MMNPAIRPAPEVYLGINLVLSTMLDQWYSEYLYGIILFLSVNVIPILIRTIYTRKYIKQIDNIFNDKTDNENRMRKYLEKKRQIEETFDSIDKEKIDSRISYYIYKINRSMLQDTSILHNVDLGSLFTSIQKLIATYNNMYPLMTSRSFNQGREGKGGYIAIFRLRRRIKRNLSRILNVCYYYATYNKDRQERNFIQKILTEVRESEDKFLHRKLQKEIKIEMVLGMATIVVTFLAPIISSSSLPLINNSLP